MKKYTKKQKKNLKKFKNAKFNYNKFVKKYYMEKGEAYITIKVNSIDDIISRYSIKEYEWINPEFADYIEECVEYIPLETGIVIEICGVEFTEEEQEVITDVIKNYFGLKLEDKEFDIRINNRKAYKLLALGVLTVLVLIGIQYFSISPVISELILLALWFFIWEYGDYRLLINSNLKLEKTEAGQLASAKIRFIENEDDSESKKEKMEVK